MTHEQLTQAIIELLTERPRYVRELSGELSMKSAKKFKRLVKTLATLEHERLVDLLPDGRFALAESSGKKSGRFQQTDRGFGFVIVEGEERDTFIAASDTGGAMNGDTVEFVVKKKARPDLGQSAEGKIVQVLERKNTQVVGEFHAYEERDVKQKGLYGYVTTNDQKLRNIKIEVTTKGLRPVSGEVILAEITEYPSSARPEMQTVAKKIIGNKNDPGVEVAGIAYKHGIHVEFPDEVLAEIKQIPDEVTPAEYDGRQDLRDLYTVTIDGADAKDLDDAITIEQLESGEYRLGVHIADVSHYVRPNTALDREAYERGVSSYLVDRVIPMLPLKLSNGICSLHPGADRLAMSCLMTINHQGKVTQYDIAPSVIRSDRRLTYDLVNSLLDAEAPEQLLTDNEDILTMVRQMAELHHILEKKRNRQGAISFESTELEFELDEAGEPVAIHQRERDVAEKLIESFMLAANETVATHFIKKDLPFLYRVHEHPDQSKMQRFIEFAAKFGLQVRKVDDRVSPKVLQEILDQVQGEPTEEMISMLLLRSMQQARYDVKPLGHYGLATEFYSHFTAPIRRYPDMMLHRLIHTYQSDRFSKKERQRLTDKLPEIAEHSSMAERRAIDAEREVDDLMMAKYMADKVGQKFDGVIASLTNFGMFIQLENGVEGLVHISAMRDDYYEYLEEHLLMVGSRTGKKYRMGDRVQVEVTNVDIKQYQIDLELVEPERKGKGSGKTQKKASSSNKKGKRQRNSRSSGSNKRGQRSRQDKGRNNRGRRNRRRRNNRQNNHSGGKNKGSSRKRRSKKNHRSKKRRHGFVKRKR